MDLNLVLQLTVYGLVLGAIYGLVAVGLTLVFGVLDVLNAAHGTFYLVGGYVTYFAVVPLGMPYPMALLLAAIGGGIAGAICERVAVARLRREPMSVLIATLALAVLVESIVTVAVGNTPEEVPTALNDEIVQIGGIFINYQRLMILVAVAIAFALIHLFMRFSRMGLAMRAVATDMETAALMGINIRTVYLATFVLSAMLAGIAGGFLTPLFSVEPTMWNFALIKAFVVVILGGMGSIYGAMLGGVMLGVAESFGAATISGFKDGIGLAVLLLFLLYRPYGLFGKPQ